MPRAGLMTMILESLLKDVPRARFMEEYFLRMPFALPGGAGDLTKLGSWPTLEKLLDQPDPDVLVVKQGRRRQQDRAPCSEEARQLHTEGYTLLVRHAEKQDPRLAELAAAFENDFAAPADVHIYCTPGDEFGFGWHYDAEDVFILQTEGVKEYSLRKNTVNPWPLLETLPRDMRYEREIMPMMKCTLQAGDWLYIPNGYWHAAEAKTNAISLAVGLMTPAALDVYDALRDRLLASMRWRQRLPITGEASTLSPNELVERYRRLFAELGEDLARLLRDEAFLRAFLSSKGVAFDSTE